MANSMLRFMYDERYNQIFIRLSEVTQGTRHKAHGLLFSILFDYYRILFFGVD